LGLLWNDGSHPGGELRADVAKSMQQMLGAPIAGLLTETQKSWRHGKALSNRI